MGLRRAPQDPSHLRLQLKAYSQPDAAAAVAAAAAGSGRVAARRDRRPGQRRPLLSEGTGDSRRQMQIARTLVP